MPCSRHARIFGVRKTRAMILMLTPRLCVSPSGAYHCRIRQPNPGTLICLPDTCATAPAGRTLLSLTGRPSGDGDTRQESSVVCVLCWDREGNTCTLLGVSRRTLQQMRAARAPLMASPSDMSPWQSVHGHGEGARDGEQEPGIPRSSFMQVRSLHQ